MVLERAAVAVAQDTLVDDGETEFVTVGGGTVARQTGDARQRTRLGVYVVASRRGAHAVLQRTVNAGNGQGGQQTVADVLVTPCVA